MDEMCVGGMSGWDVCVGGLVRLKILRTTERQADPNRFIQNIF